MAVSREQNDHPLVPHRAPPWSGEILMPRPHRLITESTGAWPTTTSRAWSRRTDYVDRGRRGVMDQVGENARRAADLSGATVSVGARACRAEPGIMWPSG